MTGFKINIANKKTNKRQSTCSYKKISKKTVGKVCIEDNEFIIRVSVYTVCNDVDKTSIPPQLVLPFTPKSFELKGREKVFSKVKDKRGFICYIRTKDKANLFPGLSSHLTTVCDGWICSGWVVRVDGKLMFEFSEAICPESMNMNIIDLDEE